MTKKQVLNGSTARAIRIFEESGGIMRTSEALARGIHASTLYRLRDEHLLEFLARGVYKLRSTPELSQPDLVTVARKIPKAVICLISALDYHDLTTQIPHKVDIMLPRGTFPPSLDYPQIHVHTVTERSYEVGQEIHRIDDLDICFTNPEKTLVDCVKFRNQIGKDVMLEAFKSYRSKGPLNLERILEYARVCRVYRVIVPFLEGLM